MLYYLRLFTVNNCFKSDLPSGRIWGMAYQPEVEPEEGIHGLKPVGSGEIQKAGTRPTRTEKK